MPHLAGKNLATLAQHFPALAAQIQSTPIPEGFAPAIGTDKTPTYARIAISNNTKQIHWLGHTSMPAASAPHIIKSLDAHSNGQNGLGLSVGTGFEWVAFLQKLPRAQLLYVYEPDLSNLRMALEICDLAAPLASRRLILLAGTADAAAGQLAEFLAQNIGFEPPAVLHPLPTLIGDHRNQFLTAGEAIVRRAVIERQSLLAALHEKFAAAPASSTSTFNLQPSAFAHLAFLLTPSYPHERPIQNEIPNLAAPPVYLDRHETAGLALRFQLLAAHAKNGPVKIISDLFRAQLSYLPAEIPVETWIPPLIGPVFWERLPAAGTFAPADKIIVHHAHHADLLQSRGITQKYIEIRPLKIPKALSAFSLQPSALSRNSRIALLADLPLTDPAALGIQLPTHLAVFAAARDIIVADYLTVHPAMAPDILRRALSRAGVDPKIDDPALKDAMLRIIRDVLIPALPLLILATHLAREGLPLFLAGDWPGLQLPVPSDAQFASFQEMENSERAQQYVWVHLDACGRVPAALLEWGVRGAVIVHAAHPTDRLTGSLPQYLSSDKNFPAPQNLISTLKTLARDPAKLPNYRAQFKV